MISTIIFLVILVSLLYIILRKIRNRHYKPLTLLGGSLNPIIKCPMPFSATNYALSRVNLNEYSWSPKYDGIHCVVKIDNNIVYELNTSNNQYTEVARINLNDNHSLKGINIFEAERMLNGQYYILDAMYMNSRDITREYFPERMGRVFKCKLPNGFNKMILHMKINKFSDVLKEANDINRNTDGIILHSNHTTYNNSRIWKLKPTVLHTIDCFLKYDNDNNVYKLYVTEPVKTIPLRLVCKDRLIDSKGRKLIPCETPFLANMFTYNPQIAFEEQPGYNYTKELKEAIKQLQHKNLDGKICEMSFNGIQPYPVRERFDKEYPNNYHTAEVESEILFSKIVDEKSYFNNEELSEFIIKWHNVNRNIRQVLYDKYVPNAFESHCNFFDLCAGRGGDVLHIINKGFTNIFAVDGDKIALETYYHKMQKVLSDKGYGTNNTTVFLNVIAHMFKKEQGNTDILLNNMRSRVEYPQEKFDVTIMNFAMHYHYGNFKEIGRLIKETTSGTFIFTCFSGDRLLNLMKNNKIDFGEIVITYDPNTNMVSMPMFSIKNKEEQYEEPLITDKDIEELNLNCSKHFICEEYEDLIDFQGIESFKYYFSTLVVYVANI